MGDIDEIKRRADIVEYIGRRVALKRAGRNFKGLCPFHHEKTPSFMVSPDRQTFHCFGCAAGGSVIDFIMAYEHLEFVEALEQLAKDTGVTLTRSFAETPQQKLREKLYEINALASDYYQYILTKHALGEKAMRYLKNRGISDKSIVTFGIGYSPNSWDALTTFLHKKGFDDKTIETAGLAIRGNRGLYDRFRGRVMFTLKDHRGKVVAFSGRVLDPEAKEAKYINTSETPVYIKGNMLFGLDVTKDAIVKSGEAVVMEGEVDLISSFQNGVGNVVAIKGSALTEAHISLLKRYTERIVFCLDSDLAGDAASRRGIELADQAGMDMRVVTLPSGKDPDEAARTDPVAFKKAITSATPIYDYFIASAIRRYDLATAFGKKKAADELLPVLSRITNPIVQGHYIKKVAHALDVTEETVGDGVRKVKQPLDLPRPAAPDPDKQDRTSREKSELYLLSLILAGNPAKLIADMDTVGVSVRDGGIARIVETLKSAPAGENGQPDVAAAAKTLAPELVPLFDEAYLADLSQLTEDREAFEREWSILITELARADIRERIRTLTKELELPDRPEEETTKLQTEISRATTALKALEKRAQV
jgi:DNA primase